MAPSPVTTPELVLVAGPNGSGKTTVVEAYIAARFPAWPRLNADHLLLELEREYQHSHTGSPPSPLAAAQMIDDSAMTLARLGSPFILETVLSSEKYKPLITIARACGLVFRFIYITTESPDINVLRVEQRVRDGGHDVPEARIRSRWDRSMSNLPWFAERADRLIVVDNSGEELRTLAIRHLSGPLEIPDTQRHPASEILAGLDGKPPITD